MQVLDYQTPPLASDQSFISNKVQDLISNQSYTQKPIQQLFNNTIDAINQTLQKVVHHIQAEKLANESSSTHSFEDDWNFLYFVRLLFYVVVILKLIELVFSKRKKMDIKERVYRKYVFSHAEMIREFNDEDRKVMDTTLKNTIKNASIDKNLPKLVKKISNKRVNFHENKNEYIEPRKNQQGNQALLALQMFLSTRPIKIEQMQRQQVVQDEPSDKDFEIVETISQMKQNREINTFVNNEKIESTITQSTTQSSIISNKSQQTEEKKQSKQKDF